MLQYLARYVHRVAITNSRLVDLDDAGVTIRHKDRGSGRDCSYSDHFQIMGHLLATITMALARRCEEPRISIENNGACAVRVVDSYLSGFKIKNALYLVSFAERL